MLLLTAKLPPGDEETLFRRMYWRREEVRLIRASTVRPNIEYSVVDVQREQVKRIEQVSGLAGQVLNNTSQPEGKAVIMCESKPEIKALVAAGWFRCESLHTDMPED